MMVLEPIKKLFIHVFLYAQLGVCWRHPDSGNLNLDINLTVCQFSGIVSDISFTWRSRSRFKCCAMLPSQNTHLLLVLYLAETQSQKPSDGLFPVASVTPTISSSALFLFPL